MQCHLTAIEVVTLSTAFAVSSDGGVKGGPNSVCQNWPKIKFWRKEDLLSDWIINSYLRGLSYEAQTKKMRTKAAILIQPAMTTNNRYLETFLPATWLLPLAFSWCHKILHWISRGQDGAMFIVQGIYGTHFWKSNTWVNPSPETSTQPVDEHFHLYSLAAGRLLSVTFIITVTSIFYLIVIKNFYPTRSFRVLHKE